MLLCSICENRFEAEDMAHCPAYGGAICSLCCTLESRCHDRCKTDSRAAEQAVNWLNAFLPKALSERVNFRVGHYMVVALSLVTLLGTLMGMVYTQETALIIGSDPQALLQSAFLKVFAILLLVIAACSWWIVLGSESRRIAQDESNRDNQLLALEIEAHSRTYSALKAARDVADSANQAKTRYVVGMTHELRTPLNSILGYSQILLKNDLLSTSPRESVRTIHRSGEHLLGLIDGLLDLSRIEAGRMQLDPSAVHLPDFLDDLVRMVRPQVQAKGLHFVFDKGGNPPEWINADAKRLRQVMINLISNAIRFTHAGTVTLRATYGPDVFRFDVIDTGVGVLAQDHQRIFLPFERGTAGRRHGSEPGTGLGLAISEQLTTLMGGELRLLSSTPTGSVFSVRLPLQLTAEPGHHTDTVRDVLGYLGARRTLLVVDDQTTQRQMLVGMLAPLGFELREAASGTECLASILEMKPDAVLLDISMDDMDGWQAAAHIRQAGFEDLPIIMVSANAFENQAERLRAMRCQAFVAKPILESELINTLQKYLNLELCFAQPSQVDEVQAPASPHKILPHGVRQDLLRLARLGHVRGLQTALDGIALADPSYGPACTQLRELVTRFDLESLQSHLMQHQDAK
jgi:signal transduction histidine kinase/CheY-like chemotaxis protein